MGLTNQQFLRYQRQLSLKEIGKSGQEQLLRSKVIIIGVGGLGSAASLYLAAAGIGTLGLVDSDNVEWSNLQRQIVHFTPDIGRAKVESAYDKLTALNLDVSIVKYFTRINPQNIIPIIKEYDFVIDCSDNFGTKFLINDTCVRIGKPFSHGGVIRFTGQTMTYLPGTACYRCLFLDPPPDHAIPSNEEAGIVGAVAGTLGTIQATEAIKFVTGNGKLLTNRFLTFNSLNMDFQIMETQRSRSCSACNPG